MTKKGNLAAALSGFDRQSSKTPPEQAPAKMSPAAKPAVEPVGQGARSAVPPSRRGKKALTGYFDPEVLKQLKVMAVAEDTTIQALLTEALNELFKKHGKPHIA